MFTENQRSNLSAAVVGGVGMDTGVWRQDGEGSCVRPAESNGDEQAHQAVGESCGNRQVVYLSYCEAYVGYNDVETDHRSLYDLEAVRPSRCEEDADVR